MGFNVFFLTNIYGVDPGPLPSIVFIFLESFYLSSFLGDFLYTSWSLGKTFQKFMIGNIFVFLLWIYGDANSYEIFMINLLDFATYVCLINVWVYLFNPERLIWNRSIYFLSCRLGGCTFKGHYLFISEGKWDSPS